MPLTRLIYASIHDGISPEALDRLLQTARINNLRDNITGALVVSDRYFLQLLEGARNAVGQCFMRVMQDNRHHGIQVICSGDFEDRLFAEWSMHQVNTSRVKQKILSRYTINEVFDPFKMSQVAIEDLCRTLSEGDWEAKAA